MTEFITRDLRNEDAWKCICGNTPSDDGFYPCDKKGKQIEPTKESGWTNLYVCDSCGRIINQNNLEVVGQREL